MEYVQALMAVDWHEALQALGALYLGVSTLLGGLRAVLAVLESIAEATITEDDDRLIESVVAWVERAQAFVGRWAGRLSLVPPKAASLTTSDGGVTWKKG